MGQYYKSVTVDTKECVVSWDFGSGAKLMEHSWMKNPFVKFVENLIAEDGVWHGKRIVWAGDYADTEPIKYGNDIVDENKDDSNRNLYELSDVVIKLTSGQKLKHYRYIINESKKEFVDKNKCPKDNDGWRIHPLPLLTCEGNGRGGGDYHGDNMDFVSIWARDIITVSSKKPKGYKEIKPDFLENW